MIPGKESETDSHEIKTNKRGNIIADENGKTSIDKVYAGRDIVLGAATTINKYLEDILKNKSA